ncbi:MAG: glycosyltransferase [Lachnospiraceae bacterium]|nr:glycosyltransferase [Lachnospiraceae bacterium]
MKILHLLSGGGFGGIEILCRDLAKISRDRNEFCFLFSGGEIADEMKKDGIPVYFYWEKPFLNRIFQLWNLVRKEKYDAVIVHHEGLGIYLFFLILLYSFPSIRFIKYLHCAFEEKYFYTGKKIKDYLYYKVLEKILLKSCHIIAVSRFVKESYCNEFKCDADKITVIYNGINFCDDEKFVEKEIRTSETIKLLYVGRLVDVKGIQSLLNAVKQLLAEGENIELNVLGDGEDRWKYEDFVRENNIENKIFFRGYQMDKEPYYRENPIFVYPSVWQEAFGISIVEALAKGLICVAGKVGGIPEIIKDNQNGYLFEHHKNNDLVNVLKLAIEKHRNSYDADMRKAAYESAHIFDIYTTNAMLERIIDTETRKVKDGKRNTLKET